jgi:YD repeat-containing protein
VPPSPRLGRRGPVDPLAGPHGNRRTRHSLDAGRRASLEGGARRRHDVCATASTTTYSDNGLSLSVANAHGHVTGYAYDGFDRLLKLAYPDATSGGASTSDTVSYAYDKRDLLLRRSLRGMSDVSPACSSCLQFVTMPSAAKSVTSKGFNAYEVDQSSIPGSLRIIQRGADPSHYEIVPRPGANLTPKQFVDACTSIVCK